MSSSPTPDEPTGPYVTSSASTPIRQSSTTAREGAERSPAYFRNLAQLGVQAAEALDHAHQLGVVHRDVKPANLMLDERGHLWVTDFGLALCRDDDANLTRTGDLIGTLRYMSPEQALAQRGLVDHRTDVYSLGATLYELLTLEPAMAGDDRQELLRRLLHEEPRRPRSLDRRIPVELELIVLKALAKRPEDRYATAQELADDLRRFLDDQPIRARRPPLAQRLARWTRRHRSLVAATFAVLLVAVIALSVSTYLIWREQQQTDRERSAALAQAERALRGETAARTAQGQAETARKLALAQKERAEGNALKALDVLDTIYLPMLETQLPRNPYLKPPDQELMKGLVPFYESFAREAGDNPQVRARLVTANQRLGRIHMALNQFTEGEKAMHTALVLCRQLEEQSPGEARYCLLRAETCTALGVLLDFAERLDESACWHHRALEAHTALARDHPEEPRYRGMMGGDLHNLAMLQKKHRAWEEVCLLLEEAIVHQKAALERAREERSGYQSFLRNHYELLGGALGQRQRYAEAGAAYDRAHELSLVLYEAAPTAENYLNLTRGYLNRGMLKMQGGRDREAVSEVETAVANYQILVETLPGVPEYRRLLAMSHFLRARLYVQLGRRLDAVEGSGRAVELAVGLEQTYPALDDYHELRAQIEKELKETLLGLRSTPDVVEAYRRVARLRERLATRHGTDLTLRLSWVLAEGDVGMALRLVGQQKEALPCFQKSARLLRELCEAHPKEQALRDQWVGVLCSLGQQQELVGQVDEALATYREAQKQGEDLVKETPSEAGYHRRLAAAYHRTYSLLNAQKGGQGEMIAARKAVEQQRKAVELAPAVAADRRELGVLLSLYALARWDRSEVEAVHKLLEEAVFHLRKAVKLEPKSEEFRDRLRDAHGCLARLFRERKDHVRAYEQLELGLAAVPDRWLEAVKAVGFLYNACVVLAERDPALTPDARAALVRKYTEKAEFYKQEARRRCPNRAADLGGLAWWLATPRSKRQGDVEVALELARRATVLDPRLADGWAALGAALYRRASYEEAEAALTKAIALRPTFESADGLFLAMVCWQRGDKVKADEWYDRAVREYKQSRCHEAIRNAVGHEAAALLGRDKRKPSR